MSQLAFIAKLKHPNALYKCSCGSFHIARSSQVKHGRVKSCGCLRSATTGARNTTHGKFGTPIYSVWNGMVDRCHNPNSQAFRNYGARGITVCDSWQKFENFYIDMGDAPPGLTLDREDNELGYSKTNCRWVAVETQQNNKRSNVVLQFRGESLNVTQWAKKLNVPRQLIYDRLRQGWSTERTLTEPKRGLSS